MTFIISCFSSMAEYESTWIFSMTNYDFYVFSEKKHMNSHSNNFQFLIFKCRVNHRYWKLQDLPIQTLSASFKIFRKNGLVAFCQLLRYYTIKLARAKLPAKATGTDCLRFLRVNGGNLPAPAGNSHEVFIVRVRADFFKPRDVSFYPVPNTLTKVTICCLWSQWWTLQIWICSKNVKLFLAGSSNRYP